MKHFRCVCVLAVLLAALLCIDSAAISETCGDYQYEVLTDGSAIITQYTGNAETVTVPEELEGHPVKYIGHKAFFQNRTLQSIVISGSVQEIGQQVFEGCESLRSVWIDEGLEFIGYRDFGECTMLTDIHIPESVTDISNDAFIRCSSLTEVHIPDSVTSIGTGAFFECTSLQTVELPKSLTALRSSTFYGCESLSGITIHAGVERIEESCFENCVSLTEIEIPEGVEMLDCNAFKSCVSLKKVVLPSSLTRIGRKVRDRKAKKLVLYSPFEGCESISFVVPRDSEAEEFCKRMGYQYDYPDAAQEIRFLNIPWGSDMDTVCRAMLDAGLINEEGVAAFELSKSRKESALERINRRERYCHQPLCRR